jgi:UDP-N-acetylmuramoyl-tripeptide--D-alanyl-D-alanine ligase
VEPIQLKTLCQWAGGAFATEPGRIAPETEAIRVCTDSRALQPGDLFVPLRGEHFDGHAFIEQARKAGAVGALSEQGVPAGMEIAGDFAIIKVEDTLKALQQIAGHYRQTLGLKAVTITGSNGKTSTKDFTAEVLSERFNTLKTEGNLNNHIGLPLTLLRANRNHQAGVFEIGMNHPGEIAPLALLAAPAIGIITNIGTAHIEYMGSRDAIALEKGMLAEALPADGVLILPAEEDFSDLIAKRTKARVVRVGIGVGDVQATEIRTNCPPRLGFGSRFIVTVGAEEAPTELDVPGEHMVRNALFAIAAGMALGMSLKECCAGLSKAKLTKGRLERKSVKGIEFLDDSYNANPDSVVAALRTLAQLPTQGRRIAMLGRMNELGSEAEKGHRRVGEAAAAHNIDCIVSVGDALAGIITESAKAAGAREVYKAASTQEAASILKEIAREGDLVLLKGSRTVGMEKILEGFAAL